MKIKLRFDLPLESKHGMTKERVLEVIRLGNCGEPKWFVLGDVGELIGVLEHEALEHESKNQAAQPKN